jgi:hypothetical protein
MAADVDFEWWGIHPAADAQAQPAYVERDADTPLRAAMTECWRPVDC